MSIDCLYKQCDMLVQSQLQLAAKGFHPINFIILYIKPITLQQVVSSQILRQQFAEIIMQI